MSLGIDPTKLTTRPPFDGLFPIDKQVLEAIAESIRSRGLDWERPLMVWKTGSELVVVDGHTRLAAARKARKKEVRVILRKFESERAALEYAIAEQRDRRNMSREQQAAHVMRVVEAFDRPAQGERTDLGPDGPKLDSAEETAKLAGTSTRQVKRARRIKDSGDEQVAQAVRNGELTLAAAERKIKKPAKGMGGIIGAALTPPSRPAPGEKPTLEQQLLYGTADAKEAEAQPEKAASAEEVQALDLLWDVADVAGRAREGLRACMEGDPDIIAPLRVRLLQAIMELGWLMEDADAVREELSQPSVDSDGRAA